MDELLQGLFAHNVWANARIVDEAMALSPMEWQAQAGVRPILVHMLNAERIWMARFGGGELARSERFQPEAFGSLETFRMAWDANEAKMREFMAGLSRAELEAPGPGDSPLPVWKFLLHVFLHGAQHRAEAAAILTELGRSPGQLDFLAWANR